ncbi:hypothetical protein C8R44DRAFT_881149 [Mycena epipterygia]|nr:hypothetical protein C8R44DRAFT_881149 [Mycena epipterygia]
MGQPSTEDNFYAIILGSLPSSFDPYISTVSTTSSVLGTTISANDPMLTITDEYEHRLLKKNGRDDDKDLAFYSNDSSRGMGRAGGSNSNSKKDAECFNCKKKDHYKSDCWAESDGKAGQATAEDDAAWMALTESNVLDFAEEGLNVSAGSADSESGEEESLALNDTSIFSQDFSDIFEGFFEVSESDFTDSDSDSDGSADSNEDLADFSDTDSDNDSGDKGNDANDGTSGNHSDSEGSDSSFEWIEPNEDNIADYLAHVPTHEGLDAEALKEGLLQE